MTIILDPTKDNIAWFIDTVLFEYLTQLNKSPNYINLKWIISNGEEVVRKNNTPNSEKFNINDFYNETVNELFDYFETNQNIEVKTFFIDSLMIFIKNIFDHNVIYYNDTNETLVNEITINMFVKIFTSIKNHGSNIINNIISKKMLYNQYYQYIHVDVDFSKVELLEQFLKIVINFNIETTNDVLHNVTNILNDEMNSKFDETNIQILKKKYKFFSILDNQTVNDLSNMFLDGFYVYNIDELKTKILKLNDIIDTIDANNETRMKAFDTLRQLVKHYTHKYFHSYIVNLIEQTNNNK